MAPKSSTNRFPSPFLLLFVSLAQHAMLSSPAVHDTLQVLVPNNTYVTEFVDCSSPNSIKGFSIDVFKNALSILSFNNKTSCTDVNYTCYNANDIDYTAVIDYAMSNKDIDAVIGDVTISAKRLAIVNFTQPYLDSGIVMVSLASLDVSQQFPGVFFKPFTAETWGLIGLSVILTGVSLWLLERNEHPHLRGGQSKSEQLKTAFRFVTSILIFSKRQSIKNPVAKFVMIAWILFIVLLGASYTASLSSILTVNDLSAEAKDINTLAAENLTIGYQTGSIVKDYLVSRHGIADSKLIPLNGPDDYADALAKGPQVQGGVAAIIAEIPYISLFLATQSDSNCVFSVSSKLTFQGFGFAFRDSTLAAAFSVAILNLSESGQMQKLKDGAKLSNYQCPSQVQSTQLDLKNSEGLFVLLGSATFVCIVFFVLRLLVPHSVRNYVRPSRNQGITGFREPDFERSCHQPDFTTGRGPRSSLRVEGILPC